MLVIKWGNNNILCLGGNPQGSAPAHLYVNPDGTQRATKPRDGELFSIWDQNRNYYDTWQWEGTKDVWVHITTCTTTSTVIVPANKDIDLVKEFERMVAADPNSWKIGPVKCECGSEKVGSSKHSNYCPKYDSK